MKSKAILALLCAFLFCADALAQSANIPISQLPVGGLITPTDKIPVARCALMQNCNYQVTVGQLASLNVGGNLQISGANLAVITGTSGATIPLLNGNLTFGGFDIWNLNPAPLPTPQTGSVIQLGNANGTQTRLEIDAFAASAYLSGIRADGTAASPTALLNGDEISGINAFGYNGTAVVGPRASVREFAAANWTTTSNPTYVDIATTPVNSTTQAEVARFYADGGVALPSTVTGGDMGAGTLNASGLYINGIAVLTTGGGGGGGVSSVSVTTTNGISGTVANATTTPAISLSLGAINPTSVGLTTSGTAIFSTATAGTINYTNALGTTETVTIENAVTLNFTNALGTTITAATNISNTYNALTAGTAYQIGGTKTFWLPDTDTSSIAIGQGAYAAAALTTGSQSVAIGNGALAVATTGNDYVAVGYQALNVATSQSGDVAIGYQSLSGATNGAGYNTAIGYKSGSSITSGSSNVIVGYGIGASSGSTSDVYIGGDTGTSSPSGNNNTVIGYHSSDSQVSNSGNTVVGSNINGGSACNGSNEVIEGYGAQCVSTGSIIIGYNGAGSTQGAAVTAIGYQAAGGNHGYPGYNQTNDHTAAFGYNSLASITTGTNNSAFGYQSGGLITTGTGNIAIGSQAEDSVLTVGSNNIVIGNSLDVSTSSTSNTINIGGIYTVTGTGTPSTAVNTINGVLNVTNNIGLTTTTATVPTVGEYSPAANELDLTTSGAKGLAITAIKHVSYGGSAPAVSACGTSPSIDSNATDSSGTVTVGTVAAASCTVTFANAYASFDHCRVTPQTPLATFAYSYTLSAITVTATSLIGEVFDYACDGK